ncbi:hypothetical protein A3J36_02860 [Candidatus Uhrbacteria bacterium RIFCSPLOWO2_02_FULL_54_37]|uniref:Uncharacterized protein n=1 Tax=Candidatus Uhrbacteria bacterium RIFCSPLOWO2_02_FULL_54_37 TaxID=1802412 RepID=A0A1F7VGN0_9BACT|nr:MAG: hypothetical protein A3J36_02860 [Candidatus Uhrbacteria bacterium RIFCSPLOWO2_02_FULL_54_37]
MGLDKSRFRYYIGTNGVPSDGDIGECIQLYRGNSKKLGLLLPIWTIPREVRLEISTYRYFALDPVETMKLIVTEGVIFHL